MRLTRQQQVRALTVTLCSLIMSPTWCRVGRSCCCTEKASISTPSGNSGLVAVEGSTNLRLLTISGNATQNRSGVLLTRSKSVRGQSCSRQTCAPCWPWNAAFNYNRVHIGKPLPTRCFCKHNILVRGSAASACHAQRSSQSTTARLLERTRTTCYNGTGRGARCRNHSGEDFRTSCLLCLLCFAVRSEEEAAIAGRDH